MNDKNTTTSLTERVLAHIKQERLAPTTRWYFVCLECLVRLGWLLTILLGGLAVAIMSYTTIHGWYGFFEPTGLSRVGYVIAYLPFFWLYILLGTLALAHYNVRHTKRGYRYPVWLVLSSSILLSIIVGSVFYLLGFSHFVDMQLGANMPLYGSYYERQTQFWQTPQENRWLGVVSAVDQTVFTDSTGMQWQLATNQLSEAEQAQLERGKQVRVIGISDHASTTITVCGVFPWHEDVLMPRQQLALERTELLGRLTALKHGTSSCTNMELLQRMP